MADREETLIAPTRAELDATLAALGPAVEVLDRPRRTTGGWYVRIRGRRPVPLAPPAGAARTVPRVLWVVIGIGAAAVVALAVLAGVWAWTHPGLAVLLAVAAGWVTWQVARLRHGRG